MASRPPTASSTYTSSSDYPDPEGGRDPITKFEDTLTAASDDAKDRFYAGNMAALLGGAA